ncbi:MAG: hypothetical protein Q4B32_10525, partial [Clostridia bacterium]|nr:hypothetical protein [Clostridia bacterium]
MFSAQVKAVLQELADLLTKRVDAEDGGPGSGNWGHKGRPGEVGGSGKGGGNQYRGGKKGILYTSSKRDWLNGLTGEKQQKATKFMQSMEKLKNPSQDTEVFIMRNGTTPTGASAVKEYLDLKGEARGWDKYANRLIDENLNEDDKKIVNALGLKYGIMYKGNATLPDDSFGMEGDDLRTWNDLKSKAMGGPTSGLEPSDELLITAGLKEAPKAKVPTTEEENDHWMDGLSDEEAKRIKGMLNPGMRTLPTEGLSSLERKTAMTVLDESKKKEFNAYLNEKAKALDVDFFGDIASGKGAGFLNDDQAKAIADVMQTKLDEINLRDGTNLTLPEAGAKVEQEILTGGDIFDNFHQRSYLNLKANALGMAPSQPYHPESNVDNLKKYQAKIQQSIAAKQGPADAKKLFSSKTHEERTQSIERAKDSEAVGKALMETGLMPKDAKIDLQDVDVSLARDAALSYNMVAEKFPFMAGEWHKLSARNLRPGVYARAFMVSDDRTIELSAKEYADSYALNDSYKRCVKTGFHPEGTDYRSIVTHEIGHTLDGYLTRKGVAGSKLAITSKGTIKKGVSFAGILKTRVCKELKVKKN